MPEMSGADPNSDFHFVEREDPEKIAATLVNLVQERIPQRFFLDPIRHVQVLCPMNRGSLGVRELNTALQQVLNPVRTGQASVERFGWRFQIGDKVIQTENDYDKDGSTATSVSWSGSIQLSTRSQCGSTNGS